MHVHIYGHFSLVPHFATRGATGGGISLIHEDTGGGISLISCQTGTNFPTFPHNVILSVKIPLALKLH
jgi:hypothetical protein